MSVELPRCNTTIGSEQYFMSAGDAFAVAAHGLSMGYYGFQAILFGSCSCIILLMVALFYSYENTTGATIFGILFLSCLSCVIYDIVKYYSNKNGMAEKAAKKTTNCIRN